MQKEKQNRDQLDDFSEIVTDKLKFHKLSVDDRCWNNIDCKLQSKKRPAIWWYIGAAAAIALLIGIATPMMNESATRLTDSIQIEQKDFRSLPPKEKGNDSIDVNKKVDVPIQHATNKLKHRNPTTHFVQMVDAPKETKDSVLHTNEVLPIVLANELNKNSTDFDSISKLMNHIFDEPLGELVAEIEKKKSDGIWQLGALVSSGSSISNQNNNGDQIYLNNSPAMNLNSKPINETDYSNNILQEEDFSEIEHQPSLSFGLTIRKNISKRIGIETGVVYTYLSSKFERNNLSITKAKQELHYIGVPVNVVFSIWENPRWNLYITSGVMVEKGLRQSFTQEKDNKNSRISSNVEKNGINGMQWSLNASAGISYKLDSSWNVYFEPRYTYTFDNNQPISIRTEKRHSIGMLGGLRYVIH